MPLRFWDEVTKEEGKRYYFNDEHALFFLNANGFGRIEYKIRKVKVSSFRSKIM